MGFPLLPESSPQLRARIAGILYLMSIACGFFAELFVRAKLVVYADAAATAQNILASSALYRMGFFADVTAMTCGLLSGVISYTLFKPVSRNIALAVLAFDVVSNTVSLSAAILLFAPLSLLQGGAALSGFSQAELAGLTLESIKLYELAYGLSLALFSGSCVLGGYLVYRSTFLPRFLGILLMVAGVCYFTNSFCNFMPRGFGADLFPWILMPCLLAEGAMALWLTIVGVDSRKWVELVAARNGN
jgi:hypothetical protein